MKKFSLLALAIVSAFSLSAQMSVVKEAERAMKGSKGAGEVIQIMTPAFTNPETQGLAQTWYVPGKAAFNEFDHMLGLKQFNKLGADGPQKMGKLLVQGYEYFTKAFPLDSLPDAKGKVKPKYSKDMVSTLTGHFSDYSNAGVDLYNAKDYMGAYEAWNIFCSLPENPAVKEALRKNGSLPHDTIFGEIAFNQALAAWQAEKLEEALNAFRKAKNFGYNKKQLYDYAIGVATGLKNQEAILELAEEALPLYGKEDPMYMGQVVNYYLQNKQFDKANSVIDAAIAQEPGNAQYYVIKGVLYENSEDPATKALAKETYKKAMELDPQNAQAVYNYGRQICEEAYKLSDNAPSRQDEYNVYYSEKIKPLFEQAATILEQAYQLDPDNSDVLKFLENVYYNLNDEKMLNDVKKRMAY